MNDGRQFFGYQTFIFPDGVPISGDWTKSRREYVVLYIFDSDGNYLETKHWFAGTTAETNDAITKDKLEAFIKELGPTVYKDICVKPFQTMIDGFVFGLIPDEASRVVDLEPSSTISFSWPWDGEYYT
ncbi:hypothetical protein [Pseudochryseolinea flava]|uniref:Uncharacterized protein n=1 Tax=Pseudochryseolinea flava TaxID=2059302 RepID=A0A364Y8M0_9BACT|nr:hypothetical protein [Pseudochryseolinea flava]RAW02200.1 hypothetical protein DQQ10_06570 [Pseudochryseolinea flava]